MEKITMKPEIISTDTIKPASPTPPHLRNYKLSCIDQLINPTLYIPVVFFYVNAAKGVALAASSDGGDGTDNSAWKPVSKATLSKTLKENLSKTLVQFFPLAGRFKDGHSEFDCNDAGVHYIETQVNYPISVVLEQPRLEQLGHFTTMMDEIPGNRPLLTVQANFFECGGLALGVQLSHRIGDAATFSAFIKGWASTATGLPDVVVPDFSAAASAFPPQDPPPKFMVAAWPTGGAARRLVFESSKVSALKAKAASASVPNPTRFEAITALIFKCVMSASTRARGGRSAPRPALLWGAVNLRASLVPPLPKFTFGNVLGYLQVLANKNGDQDDLPVLVKSIRESIAKSRNQLKEDDEEPGGSRDLQQPGGGATVNDVYSYSCWCKFPVYEADFGWGKPTWVSYGYTNILNQIKMFDMKDGVGVEAWVRLTEQEMALFECNEELLEFGMLNPSAA